MIRTRSTSNILKAVVAAAAVTVTLGVSACGSDDDKASDTATSSTTAAATTTSAAAAAAPTAEELQTPLNALADPAKSAAEKAAGVVNGEARLANIEAMTAALATYGQITFVVKDIAVQGATANANVDVTTVHGTAAMPLSWDEVDGTWKLSDASTCQLLALGRAPCA